jgi:hypothetical protein
VIRVWWRAVYVDEHGGIRALCEWSSYAHAVDVAGDWGAVLQRSAVRGLP